MEVFSYILTVTTPQPGVEVYLAIRNIAGTGRAQYVRTTDSGSVEVWIVPKSKRSKAELITQLQELPFINQVSVVPLSKPVTNHEVLEVRELFNNLDWDMSNVKDEEMSLFLNAKLDGKSTYMIGLEHPKGPTSERVRIIRAEDHPHFLPEWLIIDEEENEILDRELTIDDLETYSVVIQQLVEEPDPPPPPPNNGDKNQ